MSVGTTTLNDADTAALFAPQANGQPSTTTPPQRRKKRKPRKRRVSKRHSDSVYFDIETVPDLSRLELFGLPDVLEELAEKPTHECPATNKFLEHSVSSVADLLASFKTSHFCPTDEWLTDLQMAENAGQKRNGIAKAIEVFRKDKIARKNAKADRIKLLSVTPEYCQVVAIGMAIGDGEVETFVTQGAPCLSEVTLLEAFWSTIADRSPLIGYKVLTFDLPVIFFRSALLDVIPSGLIDMSPYGGDVIDLANARFGRQIPKGFGLKRLCQLCGIDVPAEGVDGSQVNSLYEAGETEKLAEYCASDVVITRELHRKWSGLFCV